VRLADLSNIPPLGDVARPRGERHLNQVVRVELHDRGGPAESPYQLEQGENHFFSYAVFSDGMLERYPCVWRCFPRGGRDGTVVFGTGRRDEVLVHHSSTHEEYLELSCWAKDPASGDSDIPAAGVAFEYPVENDRG